MNESFVTPQIISCSRRTDIPAFLMDWVLKNIKIGYVDVTNPYNKKQIYHISLKSDSARVWVWWSKNFGKWINVYNENKCLFDEYHHFFNFTINSPSHLENGLKISIEDRISQMEWLVNTFGIEKVQFRFDPIVFYKSIGDNQPVLNNLGKFEYILSKVSDLGIKEMVFSFASIYPKVEKRMLKRGKIIIDPSLKKKKEIVNNLSQICKSMNIEMYACCQPQLDVNQAHCINGKEISRITGEKIKLSIDKGQRENCGCTKSRDIGSYSGIFKCKHNCDYCYANPTKL